MLKHNTILAIVLFLIPTTARADYMVDFIRISCISDASFLDIDYRPIHSDAVGADLTIPDEGGMSIWSKNGFYHPKNLMFECSLPRSKYKIIASQESQSDRGMCGATPEIKFSLYLNEDAIIKDVVFGASCFEHPSISRISIYGREAEICFQKGPNDYPPVCKFFGNLGRSKKDVRIEQMSIETLMNGPSPFMN